MTTTPGARWRERMLEHFTAESAAAGRLTVVADPDALLTEPGIVQQLRERGFELFSFEDPVAFRFAYESCFRQRWDRGEATHLVVVLRSDQNDLASIPYDLLEEAQASKRVFRLGLAELFPQLAPQVVLELDRHHLDALARAVEQVAPEKLGANATRDFILRHVFGMAPELVKTGTDLLRILLRQHYTAIALPIGLAQRVVELLSKSGTWSEWPLVELLTSRESFFRFLEERWPHFLIAGGASVVPGREPLPPSLPGPLAIPFDHEDLRVYVDNLFAEGLMRATAAVDVASLLRSWYRIGVLGDERENALVRFRKLLETCAGSLPEKSDDHLTWGQFALRWAEALSLRWTEESSLPQDLAQQMDVLHEEIEARFAEWMLTRYPSIHSLSHLPRPTTLDKIARYLAQHREQAGGRKLALVVVDGLALDQWVLLRESMRDLVREEAPVFAWVPTLTAVSRQAIFAGEPPFYFAPSIHTTQREPQHWARFWAEHGLHGPAVAYVRQKDQETDEDFARRVEGEAERPTCKVLGLVVGTVDAVLHGAATGMDGVHASVRTWARREHLRLLVDKLLALGYEVFLTADHGNLEATGMGKPKVGAVADERGERAHVFSHSLNRAEVQAAFPGSIAWPPIGLPEDYLPLLAPERRAFLAPDARCVAHGGIALEEVIVPFVRLGEAR